jgi:hypothetical protein
MRLNEKRHTGSQGPSWSGSVAKPMETVSTLASTLVVEDCLRKQKEKQNTV